MKRIYPERFYPFPCVDAISRRPYVAMVRPSMVVAVIPFIGGLQVGEVPSNSTPRCQVIVPGVTMRCTHPVEFVVQLLQEARDIQEAGRSLARAKAGIEARRSIMRKLRAKPRRKRTPFKPDPKKSWRLVGPKRKRTPGDKAKRRKS